MEFSVRWLLRIGALGLALGMLCWFVAKASKQAARPSPQTSLASFPSGLESAKDTGDLTTNTPASSNAHVLAPSSKVGHVFSSVTIADLPASSDGLINVAAPQVAPSSKSLSQPVFSVREKQATPSPTPP